MVQDLISNVVQLPVQIEERKQHQARLLDQLNKIQVPGGSSLAPRMVSIWIEVVLLVCGQDNSAK